MNKKKLTHPLFKIRIPEVFEIRDQSGIGIWTENRNATYRDQWPSISAAILRRKDLENDSYKGGTWQEKFEDSCLSIYFKSEKRNGENKDFKGFDAYIIEAHTDAPFQNAHFKIDYLFVGILLDDDFYLEFRAVHEKTKEETLEEWAMTALGSLEILGDTDLRRTAWQEHLVAIEEEEKAYQKQLASFTGAEPQKKIYEVEVPEDGKECFKVGKFGFEIRKEDTNIQITSFSREVQVVINAITDKAQEAEKAELLNDYPGDGRVSILIPAKGIHHNGVPEGSLYFEEGKTNAPLFLHSRVEGFDYRLDFNGIVRFEKGWFLLKGEMTKSYHNKSFPITICKKFDMDTLNWNNYRFTSMKETETAKPEEVRFLYLENPNFKKFPEAILGFKNLEELTIANKTQHWEDNKLPLATIPPAIGQLNKLTKIYINGTNIQRIPKSVGQLKNLEHLYLNNCLLRSVPSSILKLPKLMCLGLSGNEIDHISKEIDLPKLTNINLKNNQLPTLPSSLAEQPKLKRVDLEHNPLISLPDIFNEVEAVELSMEDKKRLLDFEYKGADGTGLTAWEDTYYFAQYDTDLLKEIETVISANKLNEHRDTLVATVKKSIGFEHQGEEDFTKIGNHRFGGMPDLPENIPYPRFGENWRDNKTDYVYEFIGQINCTEIAHLQAYLPRKGMLFFFLETVHNVYGGNNDPGKVIYVENLESLASGRRFRFTEEDYDEMIDGGYTGYKVTPKKQNSAPSFYASHINTHLFQAVAAYLKDEQDVLEGFYDTFEEPINTKNPYQYAVNAFGFTQHEAPELQASLKLKGNPEDWMTLLTVTSAGDMQWGDAGNLFFVIHKSDLAKQDFNNVFVTLESS